MAFVDSPVTAWQRLRRLAGLTLVLLGVWFLAESLVWRSGFYYTRIAEPASNAGMVAMRLQHAREQAQAGGAPVLVFGDSRVAEGFSPVTAAAAAPALNFVNVAVPGSTARTWYYLLRGIEREGVEYAAIVVGLPYEPSGAGDWTNWPLDPNFMAPLVDWRDAREFPAGFADPGMRRRASRAIWLPALTLQKDVQSLILHPLQRWRDLRGKAWWFAHIAEYPGRDERMPRLVISADGEVHDWAGATPAQQALVESHIRELQRPQPPGNEEFLAVWLTRLHALARARGVPIIFYPFPRGPYGPLLATPARMPEALVGLAREPDVLVLPPDFLRELEDPTYFFDVLHANAEGRRITSTRVAEAVRARLAADASRGAAP